MKKLALQDKTNMNAFIFCCHNCIALFINEKAEKHDALKKGEPFIPKYANQAPIIPSKTSIKTAANSLLIFYVQYL